MFNRPYDLAIIIGVFALCIVTVGFGVQSVNTMLNQTHNTTYFLNVESNLNGSDGLVGTAGRVGATLQGDNSSSTSKTSDNILVDGWTSLKSLSETWTLTKQSLGDASNLLGIPSIYWLVISGIIVIIFVVIMYTWFRGN